MVYQTSRPKKMRWIIGITVLLVLLVGGGAYWWHYLRTPATKQVVKVGTFSSNNKPANSEDVTTPKKSPTTNTTQNISGGTDTNGQSAATTNSSQWITSTSGNITVEQPIANTTIKSGVILSGVAEVDTVHFRLIDNSVGVISEGTLNVVNGKFSGNLNFTPHASGGQLDVFSTAPDGSELNEIEIAVNF